MHLKYLNNLHSKCQGYSMCVRLFGEDFFEDVYILNSSPQDKMAAILADNISKCIYLNENDRILIQI